MSIAAAIGPATDTGPTLVEAHNAVTARAEIGTTISHLTTGVWTDSGHHHLHDRRDQDIQLRDLLIQDLQCLT